MPFLMSVLPSSRMWMPSLWSTNSTSGKAAFPCETMIAGPVSGFFSTGVVTVALPMNESSGQAGRVFHEHRVQARVVEGRFQPRGEDLRDREEHFPDPLGADPARFDGDPRTDPEGFAALGVDGRGELGRERQGPAVGHLERDRARESGGTQCFAPGPIFAGQRRRDRHRFAVGRVELEFLAVDFHVQRFQLHRYALEDRR